MKNHLLLIVIMITILFTNEINAQGWIGNGPNNLISYNSNLNLTPINIGIGTNAPTSVLHTVGDLRFQALQQANSTFSRFLLTDANGNVRWENLSSISGDDDWYVANTSNTPNNINDNIFSMGRIGINTNNPTAQLHIVGDNNLALTIRQGQDGLNGGMFIAAPTTINSGRIFMTGNILKIGRANNNNANAQDAITIDANGRVGILLPTGNNPSANFHSYGAIRFENLPIGGGNHLVVDANGNVFKSGCSCPSAAVVDTQGEIETLKNKVETLEKELEEIKKLINK